MKKTLAALLAASMLAVPAAGTSSVSSADGVSALVPDGNSPYPVRGNTIFAMEGTNAAQAGSAFCDHADIILTSPDGGTLGPTERVSSGVSVSHSGSGDKMTLIVPGDVNGDAGINARDVVSAMRGILGQTEGAFMDAADVENDGNVNAADVSAIMKYLVGWDVTLGPSDRPAADREEPGLNMSFISPMLRVSRDDTSVRGDADGLVRMAKNELENAHLLLTSDAARDGLTLEVGELSDGSGSVLTKEVRYGHYYEGAMFRDLNSKDYDNTIQGAWADPYPKLRGAFRIGENESQSFLIKVTTTADTKPGWYSAPVAVKDASGSVIKRATLRVYVWDFALDAAPACRSLFKCDSYGIASYFGITSGDVWSPIYLNEWYEYVLKNKLTVQTIPENILSDEADKYLDDPRQTAFISYSGRLAEEFNDDRIEQTTKEFQALYTKLSQKQEWLDKAYITTVDEPWGQSGADLAIKQWNGLTSILGDTKFQTIMPFSNSYITERDQDLFDILFDYCNAFCPGAGLFTEYGTFAQRKENPERYPLWGEYMEDRQFEKYGDFRPRYEKLRERGDPMWWYICVGPGYPYSNFYNTYQGAWNRVLFWEQFSYDIDGFLYWDTTMWLMGEKDSRKINLKHTNGGDGLLLYPGSLWDEGPVPVPSIRMEAVRDGIEDFQYLRQLEAVLGYEKVKDDYSNRVAKSVVQFTQDYNDIAGVRDEMGFMLESLGNK